MDFWAQHKDFVLKVLAGFVIFIVALIARSITYGDELEQAQGRNANLSGKVRRLSIASPREIQKLEEDARRLDANANELVDQIGWNSADWDALEAQLLERILRYLRSHRDMDAATLDAEVREARQAIRDDLNGGFGQLRLKARDEMVEEASEKNIGIGEGIGYENVLELKPDDLLKYLLQLELTVRLVRYAIDERVDSIGEIQIQTRDEEVIPSANPAFLKEYAVRFRFRCKEEVLARILNRLDTDKRVPLRQLRVDRLVKPVDHVAVELTVLAVAGNPEVPFVPDEEEEAS